jgi:hypothetical protein
VARRYIGDGIMVPLFISFMCFRRCQVVVSSFSHEKQRDLVERLIPTVSFSTTAMLLFLIGESMACIQEKLGDGIEDNTAECKDVVAANAGFSFVFAVCGGVQLVLIPFKTVNYSMINVLRFNFEFGEQVRARARDRASVRTLAAAAGPSAAGAPRAKLRGVEEESGEREAALSGASAIEVVARGSFVRRERGCGGPLSRWGSPAVSGASVMEVVVSHSLQALLANNLANALRSCRLCSWPSASSWRCSFSRARRTSRARSSRAT